MNAPNSRKRALQSLQVLGRVLLILFIAVIVLLVVGEILFGGILLQFLGLLLFGWVQYLQEVLPRVTLSSEIALGAVLALALATWGLHAILRWWVGKVRGEGAPWRLGWSLKITAMVLLLFATSIAATGVVHQTGWLFSPLPL